MTATAIGTPASPHLTGGPLLHNLDTPAVALALAVPGTTYYSAALEEGTYHVWVMASTAATSIGCWLLVVSDNGGGTGLIVTTPGATLNAFWVNVTSLMQDIFVPQGCYFAACQPTAVGYLMYQKVA